MDERFAQISADLAQQVGQIQTRLDNDKNIEDSRYDSLVDVLNKISLQREKQPVTAAATV